MLSLVKKNNVVSTVYFQAIYSSLKARSHLSVAESRVANITIKLQKLPPSCSVATLHNALMCFIEPTLKGTENDALLRYTTLKCERALTMKAEIQKT